MTVDDMRRALADLPGDMSVILRIAYPNASEAEVYEATEASAVVGTGVGITAHSKCIMSGFVVNAACND